MDKSATGLPEPVVLVIADISGYTRYMTANVKTFAHSQTIITELIKAMVQAVELPLEVAKLEGDAVFLFARKGADDQTQMAHRRLLGIKLMAFFEVFQQKLQELSVSTTCSCSACTHIEKLRLKLIVHSGEALFHRVLNFEELAGVDVIIVHRLLKNSVGADQYLLLTEAAQKDIELPTTARLVPGAEAYDDIGRVGIGVYYPEAPPAPTEPDAPNPELSFANRFGRVWILFARLWFRPLRAWSASRQGEFRHLGAVPGSVARIGFALLTLVLTPIYLPVGTVGVLMRATRIPLASNGPAHAHTADGSCCGKTQM